VRRVALGLVVSLAALAPLPAAAHAQQQNRVRCLHVVTETKVDHFNLRWAEAAIVHQVNTQVRPVWHTPQIRFCSWGWPIYIKKYTGLVSDSKNPNLRHIVGYHLDNGWRPFAVAFVSKYVSWHRALDHEVLEMLVDPWGRRFINGVLAEICDAVEHHSYFVWGRRLADWVKPSWFAKKAKDYDNDKDGDDAPPESTDWLGVTHKPLQVRGGFMPYRAGSGSSKGNRSKLQISIISIFLNQRPKFAHQA
jgi:hypothetical protein